VIRLETKQMYIYSLYIVFFPSPFYRGFGLSECIHIQAGLKKNNPIKGEKRKNV
jgi:hypothetical protein